MKREEVKKLLEGIDWTSLVLGLVLGPIVWKGCRLTMAWLWERWTRYEVGRAQRWRGR